MFGLDPLSQPVAIAEILLLLAFAAFVGCLLGRLVLNGRIRALRADIASREAELTACRQSGKAIAPASTLPVVPVQPISSSEPTTDSPVAYVSANPLLPALDHDDTPNLIAADALPTDPLAVDLPAAVPPAPSLPAEVPGTSMPGTSEAAVLSRIAARASEINFDRIGRATAAEADDLKDIVGVGPFLERKLYSLGIYTFRQVANFTKEDADTVNRIIEFFPGRIERDNWVDQSQAFHEKKYGKQR